MCTYTTEDLKLLDTPVHIYAHVVTCHTTNGPPQSVPPGPSATAMDGPPGHARLSHLVQGDHLRHLASAHVVPHSHGRSPHCRTIHWRDIVRVLTIINLGTHSQTRVAAARVYRVISIGTSFPEFSNGLTVGKIYFWMLCKARCIKFDHAVAMGRSQNLV